MRGLRGQLCTLVLLALISLSSATFPVRVVRYSEERSSLDVTNADSWDGWDKGLPVRSSTSDVDDGPFETPPFCFPYFSTTGSTVSISPNGFLSMTPAPLCYHSAKQSHLFCHYATAGYKVFADGTGANHPMIGLLIEDLDPSVSTDAEIRYWIRKKYDPPQDVLVVEWDKVPVFDYKNAQNTMQVELMTNGTIIFRYNTVIDEHFRGLTNSPATIGLFWTQKQRMLLDHPEGNNTVIRLDPYPDKCSTRATCGECLASAFDGCNWCNNLKLCVPNDLVEEYCSNADLWTTCEARTMSPYYYTQSITYEPVDNYSKISVTEPRSPPGDIQPQWPFYSNTPLKSDDKSPVSVSLCASNGFISYNQPCKSQSQDKSIAVLRTGLNIQGQASTYSYRGSRETGDLSAVLEWQEVPSMDQAWDTPNKYTFQTQIFEHGNITSRYRSTLAPSVQAETFVNGDTCAFGNVWSVYPMPTAGLIRYASEPVTKSNVHWQIIRAGMRVDYTPLPACQVDCWQGKCDHTTQRCVCQCTTSSCEDVNPFMSNGLCTSCPPGRAGTLCNRECTCVNGQCDEGIDGTGLCMVGTCHENWEGWNCDRCKDHHYGDQCIECPCSSHWFCHDGVSGNGTCDGCRNGWEGEDCEICGAGHAGPECEACACSSHGMCDDGIYGTGQCTWCHPGYSTSDCSIECSCEHGQCDYGITGSGHCRTCDEGWAGPFCNISCHCPSELGICDAGPLGTGGCNCPVGWNDTSDCTECENSYWGENCQNECECVNGVCDAGRKGSGKCRCYYWSSGDHCELCEPGFLYTANCSTAFPKINETMWRPLGVAIVVSSSTLLCIWVWAMFGFLLHRKRPRPIAALMVVTRSGGDQEAIPIPRVPVQHEVVQGIPLQMMPDNFSSIVPQAGAESTESPEGPAVMGEVVGRPGEEPPSAVADLEVNSPDSPTTTSSMTGTQASSVFREESLQRRASISTIHTSQPQRVPPPTNSVPESPLMDSHFAIDVDRSPVSVRSNDMVSVN